MLKLSDFGWSIYTEQSRNTFCGTLDYISPEVLINQSLFNFIQYNLNLLFINLDSEWIKI